MPTDKSEGFAHIGDKLFIGAPYHGLIKNRVITYPDTSTVAFNGYDSNGLAPLSYRWRMNKIVNGFRTLPTRSGPEITADAAANKVYRDYALLAGNLVWGHAEVGYDESIYVDSRGYPWKFKWDIDTSFATNDIVGTVTIERFCHIGTEIGQLTPIVVDIEVLNGAGLGAYSTGTTGIIILFADQTQRGDRVLFSVMEGTVSLTSKMAPICVLEVEIGETITETGGDTYPYNGGTIEFDFTFTVLKDPDDCAHSFFYDEDSGNLLDCASGETSSGSWTILDPSELDPGQDCCEWAELVGDISSASGTNTKEASFVLHLFSCYDELDAVVHYDCLVEALVTDDWVPSTDAGALKMTFTRESSIAATLRRNGIDLQTKTQTAVTSHIGTHGPSPTYTQNLTWEVVLACESLETDPITETITDTGGGAPATDCGLGSVTGALNIEVRGYPIVCERIFSFCQQIQDLGDNYWLDEWNSFRNIFYYDYQSGLDLIAGPPNSHDWAGCAITCYYSNKLIGFVESVGNVIQAPVGVLDNYNPENIFFDVIYSPDDSYAPTVGVIDSIANPVHAVNIGVEWGVNPPAIVNLGTGEWGEATLIGGTGPVGYRNRLQALYWV